MRIFSIDEAKHYCSAFGFSGGDAQGSIDAFRKKRLSARSPAIREGTPLFGEYRDCSLREVERSLFFAASHYRRSLDLMMPSSSPWAHVTLYYSSWYAARALLGMLGCAVFSTPSNVVDVHLGTPGGQELHYRGIGNKPGQEPTTANGSHRVFWDIFYAAVQTLVPRVEPKYAAVLRPVSGNPLWQIDQRNRVNYDTFEGYGLAYSFSVGFTPARFPAGLPGILATQLHLVEELLELSFALADQLGLGTDALDVLGGHASLRNKVRQFVFSPGLPPIAGACREAAVT